MTKISVIVPIYNVKEYLKTSIGSIKDQSFDDFECLLIDDGSTDGSGLLAEVMARGDARFTVYHKLNGGLSDARNYGLERAKGEFVLFFDSDDALDPKCLQYCFTAMKRDHLDMVIFDYNQNWIQENRKEVIANKYPEGTVTSLGKDHALMTKIANAAWNKMYRRDLFLTTGIRYPKGHAYQGLEEFQSPVEYGKSEVLFRGTGTAILSVGSMTEICEKVYTELKERGDNPTFVNARFVKPLDTSLLDELAKDHSLFVTVEENVKNGGFGEHVAAYMEACHPECRVLPIAIWNRFIGHGETESLRAEVGLSAPEILGAIEEYEKQ